MATPSLPTRLSAPRGNEDCPFERPDQCPSAACTALRCSSLVRSLSRRASFVVSATSSSVSWISAAIRPASASSTGIALSASTVRPCGLTSAKPPNTRIRCSLGPRMRRMPGRSMATSGAWPASTPNSPSVPGTTTCSTSPENKICSGETRSKWNVAIRLSSGDASRRFRRQLAALLHRLFDGADHVERGLRQVVVLAVAQALETFDRVGEVDEYAGRAGKHFGDVERLRQEALDLARARHGQFVLFRQLVHAQDGDDVLQRLIALEDLLHLPRHRVMLLAHDHRREHARG